MIDTPTPVAPQDWNWLLSTTAQSAAALVAIVGGFLVTRLVTLSADREALRRRAHEIQVRIDGLEQGIDERTERLRSWQGKQYARLVRSALISSHGAIPMESLLKDQPPSWTPAEEMAPYVEAERLVVQSAFADLERFVPDVAQPGIEWDSYRKQHNVPVPEGEGNEVLYDDVYAVLRKEWEATRPSNRPQSIARILADAERWNIPIVTPSMYTGRTWRDDVTDERKRLRMQRQEADGELNAVKKALADAGQPQGLWLGLAVLGYFAIVGVLVPLVLMTRSPLRLSASKRDWVVTLFLSGLVALFAYLGSYLVRFRRQAKN